jgi:hypothetical protein
MYLLITNLLLNFFLLSYPLISLTQNIWLDWYRCHTQHLRCLCGTSIRSVIRSSHWPLPTYNRNLHHPVTLPQPLPQQALWLQGRPFLYSAAAISHHQMDLFSNPLGCQLRHYPSCQLFNPCCRLLGLLQYHLHSKARALDSPVAVKRGPHHYRFRWEFMPHVIYNVC